MFFLHFTFIETSINPKLQILNLPDNRNVTEYDKKVA